MIAIIDYGAGNLHSVKNALDYLGADSVITGGAADILNADKVILPGVGSFGDAMQKLEDTGLAGVIKEAAASGKPLLGICLGLQLMFDESEESPGVRGLGLFRGRSVRIPQVGDIKIPHMGWNSLHTVKESRLLDGIGSEPYVYFVHSYYIQPEDSSVVCAYTEYGSRLDIAAESGNVFAAQFHPEKSGGVGMKILKNFIDIRE